MEAFVAWHAGRRRAPASSGADAGEPEREARAARAGEGIRIDAMTWSEIVAAGRKVGVAVA